MVRIAAENGESAPNFSERMSEKLPIEY